MGPSPQPQEVPGAQLLVARQRYGADPEASHHRQYPLRPAADEREDNVTTLYAMAAQGAGEARATV